MGVYSFVTNLNSQTLTFIAFIICRPVVDDSVHCTVIDFPHWLDLKSLLSSLSWLIQIPSAHSRNEFSHHADREERRKGWWWSSNARRQSRLFSSYRDISKHKRVRYNGWGYLVDPLTIGSCGSGRTESRLRDWRKAGARSSGCRLAPWEACPVILEPWQINLGIMTQNRLLQELNRLL